MTNPKLYKASLKAVGGNKHEAIEMMRLAEQLTEIGFTKYPETKVIEKEKYE